MKIKLKKILIFTFIFLLLVMPVFSFAAVSVGGLVPCDNSATQPCNFTALMSLINKVIDFIFKALVVPIAAVMFAYAGFLLITAGGGEGKTKAKKIFTSAVIGLLFAAGSWIIVKTLLSILGYKGAWIGL
jgi:amino acid transporter